MLTFTRLHFEVVPTQSCRTMALVDNSTYSANQTITGYTLQVKLPDDSIAELTYYKNAVTILNSNLLGLTNVTDATYLATLPDGAYTAKISICPYDQYWFEKTWYRICQLECKYYQAFLKLDLNSCTSCYSKEKVAKLNLAKLYMDGILANTEDCNVDKSTELYSVADKILDELLTCDC